MGRFTIAQSPSHFVRTKEMKLYIVTFKLTPGRDYPEMKMFMGDYNPIKFADNIYIIKSGKSAAEIHNDFLVVIDLEEDKIFVARIASDARIRRDIWGWLPKDDMKRLEDLLRT